MILDQLKNAALYAGLGPRLATAFRALESPELLRAAPGRHELQGKDILADVLRYDTRPRAQGKWEAHRRYIDVQYIVSGAEVMCRAHLPDLTVIEPYNPERDALFLTGDGNSFTISAGMFAIFFPHDAHMGGCLAGPTPEPVHKIVVKVLTT